jgi:hypothetical protein
VIPEGATDERIDLRVADLEMIGASAGQGYILHIASDAGGVASVREVLSGRANASPLTHGMFEVPTDRCGATIGGQAE